MAYSGVYIFGDSLVDAGNALGLANWYGGLPFTAMPEGAPYPSAGYWQGRFSNGYTFADLVSNKAVGQVSDPVFPYHYEDPWIGAPIAPFAGDPSGNHLNFAYGGARIIQGPEAVPDLDGQTDAWRDAVDGKADPNAMYSVTMGGNDIRDLAPSYAAPTSQAAAYAVLDDTANKLLTELSQMIGIGAKNFVLTGIPNVGLIPQYDRDGNNVLDPTEAARAAAATDYSHYLDNLLRTYVVPSLKELGANVTYVPVMDYVNSAGQTVAGAFSTVMPTIAALNGLTLNELTTNLLKHESIVFFDQIHPSGQMNALVGAYMQSLITGTPMIETLPLTGSAINYRSTTTLGVVGEVDSINIAMVAGTTYRIEMLGMSSIGKTGYVGDSQLKVFDPSSTLAGSNDDSGAGLDPSIDFAAASSGIYSAQLSAVGELTGSYVVQAGVVGGTAMLQGDSYTVAAANTLVLEGVGGAGVDKLFTSVTYALAAGSEVEQLATTNAKGKTSINLTGNEFDQTLTGNNASNGIAGLGGNDNYLGGGGNDRFLLNKAAILNRDGSEIDHILDYARGDVVDIRPILRVASGIDVIGGGYLRVTADGNIQIDLNGGGDDWATLATVNGNIDIAFSYMLNGVATSISVARTDTSAALLASSDIDVASLVAAHGGQSTSDFLSKVDMSVATEIAARAFAGDHLAHADAMVTV